MIDEPSDKYKEMLKVIKRLSDLDQTASLDEILRKKIEINKTREKLDILEEKMCEGGGAMFYFFALGLTNDEMNFCLEKLKNKTNYIKRKQKKKEEEDKDGKKD